MGEEEFAGHRIRHRRTNDVTIIIWADTTTWLLGKAVSTKPSMPFSTKGMTLITGLSLYVPLPVCHDGFAGIKVQQQIDALPGTHGELVDQFNAALHCTRRNERNLSGCVFQDNRIGQGLTSVTDPTPGAVGCNGRLQRCLAKACERAIVEVEQVDFTRQG